MSDRTSSTGGNGSAGPEEGELRLLSRSMLFEGMEPDSIARLLEGRCRRARFAKGEVIYSPARYRNSLGILLSGEAGVTKSGREGHPVTMNLLTPPMAFGVAALFHPIEEYVAEVTALAPSRVLFIRQEELEEIFRLDYGIVRRYIAFLSGRICFLNRRIDAFTTVGAPQRLAAYLADSAQPSGEYRCQAGGCAGGGKSSDAGSKELQKGREASCLPADGGRPDCKSCRRFLLPKGVTGLSQTLNMGRASLYRAFDVLTAQGLIRREGKALWIPDWEALRQAASDPAAFPAGEDGGEDGPQS